MESLVHPLLVEESGMLSMKNKNKLIYIWVYYSSSSNTVIYSRSTKPTTTTTKKRREKKNNNNNTMAMMYSDLDSAPDRTLDFQRKFNLDSSEQIRNIRHANIMSETFTDGNKKQPWSIRLNHIQ